MSWVVQSTPPAHCFAAPKQQILRAQLAIGLLVPLLLPQQRVESGEAVTAAGSPASTDRAARALHLFADLSLPRMVVRTPSCDEAPCRAQPPRPVC